ncbi:MAG: hypothetical protein WDN01_07930 [Rhizomicrobium sp.]
MAKIWVISDTHFGHANVVHKFKRADGTPLRDFKNVHEHDETMIRKWNECVRPEDHVYHLGDFAMARVHLATAHRLNGHKRLVRGNHDIFKTRDYLDAGFEEIYGVRVFRPQDQQGKSGFILSHVPLHPGSVQRWARNVHGHTHANVVLDEHGHPDPRYVCVSVEHTGYAPVLLNTL